MTYSEEELDVLVADVAQRTDIIKNALVGLLRVGAEGVDSHIAVPIATATKRDPPKLQWFTELGVDLRELTADT